MHPREVFLPSGSGHGSSSKCSGHGSKSFIKYNCKADIWSLGCILYNLVYGRPPFGHLPSLVAKVQAICNPNFTISFPPIDDTDLIDCLRVSYLSFASSAFLSSSVSLFFFLLFLSFSSFFFCLSLSLLFSSVSLFCFQPFSLLTILVVVSSISLLEEGRERIKEREREEGNGNEVWYLST